MEENSAFQIRDCSQSNQMPETDKMTEIASYVRT